MCGRFVLATTAQAVQQEFNLASLPELAPRYNIAPTQPVPIITNDKPDALTIVQWGLIPSWAKDTKMASTLINARAETVAEKPSFRTAFKYRRCLIPATGFYEWQQDKDKQPYYIHLKDREVFGFAGLWEVWRNPEGDEVWTCSIITTEPNDLISKYHHRMAVILKQDDYSTWLDKETSSGELQTLLSAYPADNMEIYPISKAVNRPMNDNPTLIEPELPPSQNNLL